MLGSKLIGIFIPIYLLTKGMTIENIVLTYTLAWAAIATFAPIAGEVTGKLGLKKTMSLRAPLYSGLLFILLTYERFGWSPGIIGMMYGMPIALYWTAMNIDFTENVHIESAGLESSLIQALPSIMGIISPIIGGYVISIFDYNTLLGIGIGVSFIAAIPLLTTIDKKVRVTAIPGKDEIELDFFHIQRFFFQGVYQVGEILIWPIFVWQLLDSTVSLGIVATLAALAKTIFAVLAGKFGDNYNNEIIIKVGALLNAAVFMIMPSAATQIQVFALTTVGGFARSMMDPLIFADFSKHINGFEKTSHNVLREMTLNIGRMLFAAFCMSFFDYKTIFEVCASASLVIFLI